MKSAVTHRPAVKIKAHSLVSGPA
uniref:Uncharacterized protein n=1 Tax=Anguilla anguilla TaxID=7936 RepID=A0A0E9VPW4_ANGAN